MWLGWLKAVVSDAWFIHAPFASSGWSVIDQLFYQAAYINTLWFYIIEDGTNIYKFVAVRISSVFFIKPFLSIQNMYDPLFLQKKKQDI